MIKRIILTGCLALMIVAQSCNGSDPVEPDYNEIDLGVAFFKEEITKVVDKINPSTQFGGGRGADQIIVYTRLYAERTNTNPYGVEAVIENGIVKKVGGNNSRIPDVGMVISGHGTGETWINEHIHVGDFVELSGLQIKVTTSENSMVEKGRFFITEGKKRLKSIEHPSIIQSDLTNLENAFVKKLEEFVKAKEDGDSAKVKTLAEQASQIGKDYFYHTFPSVTDDERAVWLEIQGMSKQELEAVFKDMADIGFNTVCPEVIYRGWSIFPNAPNGLGQYPDFIGRDPMQEMMDLGEKYNITVVPWVWVYFVGVDRFPALINSHSEWLAVSRTGKHPTVAEPGFHYFCPSRPEVREFWLEIYDYMINKYNLKHLQLDYIRYPGEPWTNDYCYCSVCRNNFKEQNGGVDPKNIDPTNNPELWKKWDLYRENNVNTFVEAVREQFPQLDISADVVPDQEYSLSAKKQNWSKWLDNDWLNTVYIMAYSSDVELVGQYIDYMAGRMKETHRGVAGLGPYAGMNPEILIEEIEMARQKGIDGSCLFIYNALTDEQKDALKKGPYRLKE
uniref:glycoside hydrolase family 10 protein n=1 Tax=uncultured Draconibacterium sp. TaxID=1573823 RepID=UPI003216A56A